MVKIGKRKSLTRILIGYTPLDVEISNGGDAPSRCFIEHLTGSTLKRYEVVDNDENKLKTNSN